MNSPSFASKVTAIMGSIVAVSSVVEVTENEEGYRYCVRRRIIKSYSTIPDIRLGYVVGCTWLQEGSVDVGQIDHMWEPPDTYRYFNCRRRVPVVKVVWHPSSKPVYVLFQDLVVWKDEVEDFKPQMIRPELGDEKEITDVDVETSLRCCYLYTYSRSMKEWEEYRLCSYGEIVLKI